MSPIQTSRQGGSDLSQESKLDSWHDFAHHPLSVGSKWETESTYTLFLSKRRVPQFIHHCSLLHHHRKTKRLQGSLLSSTIPGPLLLPTSYVYCAGLLPPMSTHTISVCAFLQTVAKLHTPSPCRRHRGKERRKEGKKERKKERRSARVVVCLFVPWRALVYSCV